MCNIYFLQKKKKYDEKKTNNYWMQIVIGNKCFSDKLICKQFIQKQNIYKIYVPYYIYLMIFYKIL